jgi:hypothetical protein
MNAIEINETRLNEVLKLNLRHGMGKSLADQVCVMQAVDYVASGGFSDHPECACPALTSYAIRLNDRADDETRQLMKPLIPKLIGTRDGATKERANFLVFHSITVTLPILVEAAGLPEDAAQLRAFKLGEWEDMRVFCTDLRSRLRGAMNKKADAADAAAYAAAYAAADAATDAADAAAYAATDAADADKPFWQDVRKRIWHSAFEALGKACEIRKG